MSGDMPFDRGKTERDRLLRRWYHASEKVMVDGFHDGTAPKRVLVRLRGPSMAGAPFYVPGTLANPMVQLFSGSTVIAQNDN